MTETCQKTQDAKDCTCGVYNAMPTLIHRIMDCMLNLESYNIDLNDIHFMFAGLELTKTGVIPSRAIVSAQLLKEAIIEKMPIINGASGVSGILAQFKLAYYERKNHSGKLPGRANMRDEIKNKSFHTLNSLYMTTCFPRDPEHCTSMQYCIEEKFGHV
ncbi:hypothetical protein DAPPUDRAFT_318802 [Daphnia pulex]|uniref:Uncharacterized protein n=1 Tax=Daphnia pulex TaxID=6669 RepID=E9GJQ1_DAPPU|nr:hypothetical protein DAPPUDRAFT_318802 [Daphnia pulex]|eukprot:EFX80279.1 hypothetical protein DAPPUDRAFT_318802 [Daphnia pulex]